jgi:hypothetical protein
MGIESRDVSVIGRLDQIEIANRHLVTPFVGVISPLAAFQCNPEEVQEAVTLPVEGFFRAGCFSVRPYVRDGRPGSTFYFVCGETTIWGATARVLKLLLEIGCAAKFTSKRTSK